jgi:hypothetical protein
VNGYPVPFRISTIRTEEYGMVEVVTSQYKTYYGPTRYETALFWGNCGESHDVSIGYDRTSVAKFHFKLADQNAVIKEIKKYYNQQRNRNGSY